MGNYLNSKGAYAIYKSETVKPYFIDKSNIFEDLFPLVESGNNYICITRPRRFGKTIMANMISAFFSDACDSEDIFLRLNVSKLESYRKYLNQCRVIHISFNEVPRRCTTYEDYIERIEKRLIDDLKEEYPDFALDEEEAVWDILSAIYAKNDAKKFLFVLDEWDFIFHRDFVTEQNKREYITFLSNLLKDKPYVSLTYMTGILPIAKYSSGSELNMFLEYTMASEEKFSDYFGFTETEVDLLYARYREKTVNAKVTRQGLKMWYNGYHTYSGERVYNPRSVVVSLTNNNLGNYWTSAGPYDEIYYYIEKNVDDVRDDLALMISGQPVLSTVKEYAATSMDLQTKEEIFSAMVVYGFLSYENGFVAIPNKELMDKFADMLKKESSLGYVNRLAKESMKMLQATIAGDTETMEKILELAHDTEVPILSYNNEVELSALVNLVYLSARDYYRVEREDRAGIGYVDFIFYPERKSEDCIILELKVNHSPEEAIQQIKDRRYANRFRKSDGKGECYTGRILAVGISYDKKEKKHHCKVESLK